LQSCLVEKIRSFIMAQQNTFDITSKIDHAEVVNAIQQALKEVQTRFDFKDSKSNIETENKDAIILTSDDEYRLNSLNDILQGKFVKRGVPLKGLTYGKVEQALGGTVRQRIMLQQGIPQEKAKEIVKQIKDSKLKVQASIQGDLVRVSGKDRDVLQQVMALLRNHDFGIDMQFGNYRTT
jgi:cyclic-di-GMP-binding protein